MTQIHIELNCANFVCSKSPSHTWYEFWRNVGTVPAADSKVRKTIFRMTHAINSARIVMLQWPKRVRSCNSHLCQQDRSPSSFIVLNENAIVLKDEHESEVANMLTIQLRVSEAADMLTIQPPVSEAVDMQTIQLLVRGCRYVNNTTPCFWSCADENNKLRVSEVIPMPTIQLRVSESGTEPYNKLSLSEAAPTSAI